MVRPSRDGKATLEAVRGAMNGRAAATMRLVLVASVFVSACGVTRPAEDASRASLRVAVAPLADPTLKPARLVPLRPLDDEQTFRIRSQRRKASALVAGVRIVRLPNGGIESAIDPLPGVPLETVEVPSRLGGGFLFAIGPKIYHSEKWLAPLELLYAAPLQPTRMFVGLDRIYVRLTNAAYAAFDARTGMPMDLGPWPTSPEVTRYVAADGWRAVAIADMRGAIATFDAGTKWQPLNLPIRPVDLKLVGDAIVVTGTDGDGAAQSYAVQPTGQVAHLEPEEHHAKPKATPIDMEHAASKNPVVQAVLDGYPLEGGAALIARDGVLSRVRIADGAVLDQAPDAFPLKPARCHAISLSPPKSPVAFGFVCGVPHGATEIYAYDAHAGKLVTLRHFDAPRAVFSPANGTLVVEGACDADATPDAKKTEQAYCLMHRDRTFEDFVVNGDVGTERVVPLSDGRTAILSPPVSDLATARVTIFDGKRPTTIPIVFDDVTAKKSSTNKAKKKSDDDDDDDDEHASPDDDAITTAVLRSGTWLRGVEERTPGVLSAWVEHSGHYVGVEVNVGATAGHAKHGKYVAELGNAVVSGRYGLGWSASRQGYETIDGGMTWTALALPEPLEAAGPAAGATSHGCGPLGCVLAGWIRVGWGTADDKSSPDLTSQTPRTVDLRAPESLALRCELDGKLAAPSNDTAGPAQNNGYYGYSYRRYGYGGGYGQQPVSIDWTPFFTIDPPKLATDDLGFSRPIDDAYERPDRNSQSRFSLSRIARIYAWGPKGLDWDTHGKFMVRFTSPFESSSSLHATQTMPTPTFIAEGTNFIGGGGIMHPIQSVAMISGDDATHALLVVHRTNYGASSNETVIIVEVESERPPMIAHRLDGQPIGDVESAVRMAGHWYVATTEPGTFSTTIWDLEGGALREVVRIPRVNTDTAGRVWAMRLARRADNHMLAAMLEGVPTTEGAAIPSHTWWPQLYALPIDVDAGTVQDPERLGPANGATKSAHVCGAEDGGWVVDGRWPGGLVSLVGAADNASIQAGSGSGMLARYHVTPTSLCIEKISVAGYGQTTGVGSLGKMTGADAKPTASVAMYIDRARQSFRCVGNR